MKYQLFVAMCIVFCFLNLIGGLTAISQAEELRFGFVDPERVFMESKVGKIGMEELGKYEKERTAELDKKKAEIEEAEKNLRQQAVTLSPSARDQQEEEIKRGKIDLKRMAEDADRELNDRQKRYLEKIDKEVMVILQKYGDEHKFTAIFSKAGGSLLYVSNSIDITDDIIKLYDATHESSGTKEEAKPAAETGGKPKKDK